MNIKTENKSTDNKPNKVQTAITPTRQEDYPEWYQQVVKAAELAENSPVRGCMVIKPWGYGIWENIQRQMDELFSDTGVKNAYFPLLIPLSFLEKEAQHVAGFAKECAVVTHTRLRQNQEGKLIPENPLEEPFVIRPTSETIIGDLFAKWVQSYRDLPLLINQWCNVMRWEMRTRLFLRTSEFLWQEGHTAHSSELEAKERTHQMLEIYRKFAQDVLAMPVIVGRKSEGEKFPGAEITYSIEALMQDRKALQAGTSHYLGQHFAKASQIKFLNTSGNEEFAYTTSWGVSTRLIGALIMTHSDDDGLRLPPKVASTHIVFLPIYKNELEKEQVFSLINQLQLEIKKLRFNEGKIKVEIDDREVRGGAKSWHWVKKGVPLRIEIGPKDVANQKFCVSRRDQKTNEKKFLALNEISQVPQWLEEIQNNYYQMALKNLVDNTLVINSQSEFIEFFTAKNANQPEIHGGFAFTYHCGEKKCEDAINDQLKVTLRNIPENGYHNLNMLKQEESSLTENQASKNTCVWCQQPAQYRAVFAKSY